ncbi:MAG TPA: prolipoprotein diacylglyceryl transferase [Solirubrobacteraceae bacterium]
MITTAFIPSPSSNGLSIGPFFFHAYGIAYVFAVAAAIFISRWGWRRQGGDPDLCYDVAIWAFPAGLIGGRIYFDITTPSQVPDHWWGVFAIWQGGLGIWGGIAAGAAVGLWVAHRRLGRADLRRFMDVVAPSLLIAQAIGRIGNYFNQELFGKPTKLPWGLEISPDHRPAGFSQFATFQPTFLYEIIWNVALAGLLIWLGQTRRVRPPGVFALYVAGYSGFRIFEETLRIDYSNHVLGLRLNFFVALVLCLLGLAWFVAIQRGWGGLGGRSGSDAAGDGRAARRPGTAAAQPAKRAGSRSARG